MKKLIAPLLVFVLLSNASFSQDIIKGFSNTVSLVKKSAKLPSIKNKDGSTIVLSYKEGDGLKATMGKNAKTLPLGDPFPNALFLQVAEGDIDKDGKVEILLAARTSAESVELQIYKKAEFETLYELWTTLTGVQSFEFPGDGTVKLYDMSGSFGLYKILDDGKLNAL